MFVGMCGQGFLKTVSAEQREVRCLEVGLRGTLDRNRKEGRWLKSVDIHEI